MPQGAAEATDVPSFARGFGANFHPETPNIRNSADVNLRVLRRRSGREMIFVVAQTAKTISVSPLKRHEACLTNNQQKLGQSECANG